MEINLSTLVCLYLHFIYCTFTYHQRTYPDIYKDNLKVINIDYTDLFEKSLCSKYEQKNTNCTMSNYKFRTPKKDVLFIIGDWNAKVGSQEIPGVTGKFGLRIWNEAGQRLVEFCQENVLDIANTLFQEHKKTLNMDITR